MDKNTLKLKPAETEELVAGAREAFGSAPLDKFIDEVIAEATKSGPRDLSWLDQPDDAN